MNRACSKMAIATALLLLVAGCSDQEEPQGVVRILSDANASQITAPRKAMAVMPVTRPVRKETARMLSGNHSEDAVDQWLGRHQGKDGSALVLKKNEDPGSAYPYKAILTMTTDLILKSGTFDAYPLNDRLVVIQGSQNLIFQVTEHFRDMDRPCLVESAGEYFCR